jgi:hypothetical protein
VNEAPINKGRRALTHVGGEVELAGDRALAEELGRALEAPSSLEAEEIARAHVHGFHSYPARMHPLTARRLIEAFSSAGEKVLDPFCGSGTVLVEARLAGRGAIGIDANPLAVRLAVLKARGVGAEDRARLLEGAKQAATEATTRRKARAGASRRYGKEDVALFAPHVLLELDGLRVGIDAVADGATRRVLELVLSSILVKVSRKAGDTSELVGEKRIAAGYPTRLFEKKTEELVRRLAEVAEPLLAAPPLDVRLADARAPGGPRPRVELAVTSPPYPGNYDYLAHHAARLRWLRLDARGLEQDEIGARRHLEPLGADAALARFGSDMAAALAVVERVLVARGRVALLIADSVVLSTPIYAVDVIARAAADAGLVISAVASQARPHFHGPSRHAFARRPRREHLILLSKR